MHILCSFCNHKLWGPIQIIKNDKLFEYLSKWSFTNCANYTISICNMIIFNPNIIISVIIITKVIFVFSFNHVLWCRKYFINTNSYPVNLKKFNYWKKIILMDLPSDIIKSRFFRGHSNILNIFLSLFPDSGATPQISTFSNLVRLYHKLCTVFHPNQ